MAFSFPFFLKNGNKKKRNNQFNGNLPSSSLRDQVYPTLASIVQQKTSPNPSPTSSTSSHSQPPSIISSHAPPLIPEELDDNSFYVYLRSHFNTIFTRSTVVCIPHSRSLEGIVLTKDFIETHCCNASPYYRGQYQAANGKVIAIEQPLISTISGFKEQRTIHIMSEEWVYIGNKKIRVYMTQRPLEGEASQHQKSRNTINIPTCRNSKSDFDFLNMFAENAEPLIELQSAVQEFVDTYVYIRGFNNYTVEKIQHIYTKAYKTILQRNKLIRDTCRNQAEHDYFLELVENVVMGFLHEKLWIQSLRSILQSQDAYISSICQCYSKDDITLQRYAVSYPISEIPLSCFQQAIACLQQTDTDSDTPSNSNNGKNSNNNMDNTGSSNNPHLTGLAFTPLEKITCVKSTLDLISTAVDEFIKEVRNGSTNNDSFVTTDEMIPLLAYVITHARISRIASLAFYIEHFRLTHMERSEHGFALVTLKTAISFLKGDPLSLLDASSTISTISTNSTSSTVLSPQLQSLRSRSTSFGSPMTSPTFSSPAYNHYQGTGNYRPSSYQSPQSSSTMTGSSSHRPSSRLHHRKSRSADLQCLLDSQQQACVLDGQQQTSSNDSGKDDGCHGSSASSSRRSSMTSKFHSSIQSQKSNENRHSLDISNDWMVPDASRSSPDIFSITCGSSQQHQHHYQHSPSNHPSLHHQHHHQHQQQTYHHLGHHNNPTTPPKHVLGHSQPMISTTLPTLSNSTPLPGNSPPTSSAAASQHYYYYRHQQYPGHHSVSPKMKGSDEFLHTTDGNSDGMHSTNISGSPTPHSSPKPSHLSNRSSWYLNSGPDIRYMPYNDIDDANNSLGQSLATATVSKDYHLNFRQQRDHYHPMATSAAPVPSRSHTPSHPPTIINIPDRLSFDGIGRRPASICIDTRASSIHRPSSIQSRTDSTNQEDMGDFLLGLQQMDGDITGNSGHFRMA